MWLSSSCTVKRSSPKKGSFFQDTRASAASRAVLVRCQDKYRKRGLWGGLASAEVCHEGAQKSDNSWRISSGACRVYITFAVRIEAVGKPDAELIERRFPLRRGLGDTTKPVVGGRHGLTMTSATITLLPDRSSCEYETHREAGELEIPIFPPGIWQ